MGNGGGGRVRTRENQREKESHRGHGVSSMHTCPLASACLWVGCVAVALGEICQPCMKRNKHSSSRFECQLAAETKQPRVKYEER